MSRDYPVQSSNIGAMREQAVEVLMEHFSNDVMGLEEFEGLLDAVNGCSTAGELRELLSKLPPLESSKPATDMIPASGGRPVVVDADRVRDHGFMCSVLGSTNRAGRWILARRTFALGVLGGVEIVVPPEMAVDVNGMALLGGFENQTDAPLRSDPDSPTLRIQGLAVLGGVNVEVRLPGETSRQAKKRRRLERKGLQPRLMSGGRRSDPTGWAGAA